MTDIREKIDNAMDQHWERNDSASTANRMKETLKGKDKNWNRSCGEYLGFDDRVGLMTQINKLVACHSNAVVDLNRQLGPFVGAYEIATYEEEIRKGIKTRVVQPDMINVPTPWYMITTLLPKIYSKYHKNYYYNLDNEDDGTPYRKMVKRRNQGVYISPSNNPEYKWVDGWEFGIEPFGHKNVRAFMKARLGKKRKYIKAEIDARDKERRRVEAEKAAALEIQVEKEKKEMSRQKYLKRYESLDNRDYEVYAICEKRKAFTTLRNRSKCLYIGKTSNFAARRKVYRDFNKPNNEIVNKLVKKFPKKTREENIKKLTGNIVVKRFKFKCLQDDEALDQFEGYLIKRIKPLLNTSKTNNYTTDYNTRRIKIEK